MIKKHFKIAEAKSSKSFYSYRENLRIRERRIASHNVNITLNEFPEPSLLFLSSLGAPNGLNLIASEWFRKLMSMLCEKPRQRHCKVVTKTKLVRMIKPVNKLVCLTTVLSQKRIQKLYGRSLYRDIAPELKHFFYSVQNSFSCYSLMGQKIPHTPI